MDASIKARPKRTRWSVQLLFLLPPAISIALGVINIAATGYGNTYYASAIRSMLQSWHNFFFVSFDPGGFVTVDKPPLGLWIQTAFAKVFGYHGWSILLPQALSAGLSVWLIERLIRRDHGDAAGFIAGLFMAFTPVLVVTSRNNTMDNELMLILVLATMAFFKCIREQKPAWLVVTGVLVGLGFLTKMTLAYLIMPGVLIVAFIALPGGFKRTLAWGVAASAAMLAVSLSWPIIVDMTPASERPYIDSSTNNTVMELIVGHNFVERFGWGRGIGRMPGRLQNSREYFYRRSNQGRIQPPQGNFDPSTRGSGPMQQGRNQGGFAPSTGPGPQPQQGGFNPQGSPPGQSGMNGRGGFGGGGMNNGQAGPLRLFQGNFSIQMTWTLGLAILGAAIALASFVTRKRKFAALQVVFWLCWLLIFLTYVSFTTGTMHSYYLAIVSPPLAALIGIGSKAMRKWLKGKKTPLVSIALILSAALQIMLAVNDDNALMLFGAIICVIFAAVIMIVPAGVWRKRIFYAALLGLLVLPARYSIYPIQYGNGMNSTLPAVFSSQNTAQQRIGQQGTEDSSNIDALASYLIEHRDGAQFILVTQRSSGTAAELIVRTGEPVMSLGGFLGQNNALTTEQISQLADEGRIKYFMIGGSGRMGGVDDISTWVREHCVEVTDAPISEVGGSGMDGGGTLYEYAG